VAGPPLSRHLFRQQVHEGFFSLFKRLSHALKKDGRALHRVILTGTIDLPPPGLGRIPSPLHDERKIGWVKLSCTINGDGRLNFQTAATSDQRQYRSCSFSIGESQSRNCKGGASARRPKQVTSCDHRFLSERLTEASAPPPLQIFLFEYDPTDLEDRQLS
jgi:hypothetical protein